ncbi:spore germination protein [Alkaliphilus hydrothermalis]|nr:spore germination protein [Alkaliphilus hydrothermalis]
MKKFRRKEIKKPKKILPPMHELGVEDIICYADTDLFNCLQANIEKTRGLLNNTDDIAIRYFDISTSPVLKGAIIYIKDLVDTDIIQTSILTPLTLGLLKLPMEERCNLFYDIDLLINGVLVNADINTLKNSPLIVEALLAGNSILLFNGHPLAVSVNTLTEAERKYADPKTEKVIKGPQQGFVENIDVNISILRKKLKSQHFVVKDHVIGRESKSKISIIYLSSIADQGNVDELFQRLADIDIDGFVSSQYIEELVTDEPTKIFSTIFSTERPDRVEAMLLEGRIAILCDGSPFCLVVPSIITDFFISSESYYTSYYLANFNRLLSYFGALVVMFLPATYVAVTTFHQEVLPTKLALTIAGTRAGVPFPAFIEALIMEIAFEALREAGTLLPTHIGQTISIVGALIIGQAAVEAGLVSPAVVIIVATTAIFSFTIPYSNFSNGLRLTRFFNMTLASILGIYGIITAALLIALNLISMRSFGVPFMIPFAPFSLQEMKDWVLRFPQWAITKRSQHITKRNLIRKSNQLKPKPPQS